MVQKVIVVTGANSGIGLVTAQELAAQGERVILLCRDRARGEAAQQRILAATSRHTHLVLADLGSLTEVRRVAAELVQSFPVIDVLVNNAGVYLGERRLTGDGFEAMFAINHLGPFLLTNLLKPALLAANAPRVVNVSSMGHHFAWLRADNLNGERFFNPLLQYCNTKLENVLFTRELARRSSRTQLCANALHPGSVATGFAQGANTPFAWGARLARPFLLTPERGAATSIFLAVSPQVNRVSGKYFARSREVRTSRAATDAEFGAKLWEQSSVLCGLSAGEPAF
jgi:NAD(P)-dependent dehydrogenase (short-subunit alcohol dehydrogenase family)